MGFLGKSGESPRNFPRERSLFPQIPIDNREKVCYTDPNRCGRGVSALTFPQRVVDGGITADGEQGMDFQGRTEQIAYAILVWETVYDPP